MINRFSKKFWISFSSSVVVGTGIILACSGGYWEEYGSSNFTPESFVDVKYNPFFYSYNFYYQVNYDENHNHRFNKNVLDDWHGYLDKKCSDRELKYLLFQTTESGIDSISRSLKKDDSYLPVAAKNISFLKDKKNKKVNDFINYLALAKKCEAFAIKKDNEGWYYDGKPTSRICPTELADLVKNQYKGIKDLFLKERYFFQTLRALYFNNNYSECSLLFENEKNNFRKNYMYYRSMAYAAGAYYKSKDYTHSNYYFSLVYEANDDLKTVAHWSFKPQDEKNWQSTLSSCTSNEEKITLWHMLGIFYNDEIRSMNEIYKLNPSSEKLDLLLARAINKYENDRFDFNNNVKSQDAPKPDKLKEFISGLLNNKAISKPYMWEMAYAYIETIDKQYASAEDHLKSAEKTIPKDPLVKAQLRLLRLINDVSALKKIGQKEENDLLADLSWLAQLQKDTSIIKIRSNQTFEWLLNCMAKKYTEQEDLLKAEFFKPTSDYYVNEKQLNDMKNFLRKENKSPYEELCKSIYPLKYDDIVEFEAVYKTFNGKIEEALLLMEQSKSGSETELLSNPFNGNIKDCHDCDHSQPKKAKYTKLNTLKKMKEMTDKISADPYNNALLLGNVYYSITYFGSSRAFYDCGIYQLNDYDRSYTADNRYKNDGFRNKLTDMAMARKYYYIALSGAKTPEQKAKCLYMLAKCERNDWYTSGQGPTDEKAFIPWKQFLALKAYSKTNYYQEVIKECGYFRSYTKN